MGLFDKILRKTNKVGGAFPPARNPAELPPPHGLDPARLTIDLDSDAYLFYSTDLGFSLYLKPMTQGMVLTVGDKIPVACMFETRWLLQGTEKVGYLFNSQFQVSNRGGFIMTYTNSGAGKATAVEVLVKTDTLVIYHYPNHGTLVISPHIGPDIENILDSQ